MVMRRAMEAIDQMHEMDSAASNSSAATIGSCPANSNSHLEAFAFRLPSPIALGLRMARLIVVSLVQVVVVFERRIP